MRNAPPAKTIDAWMSRLDPQQRAALDKLRGQIHAAAPGAEEAISYGMPTFKLNGNLVAFGAFAKHLSFFPMSATLIAEHADALEGYSTSKGTIQFTPEKPIPAALIRRIVKARIAQNLEIAGERATAKKSKATTARAKK